MSTNEVSAQVANRMIAMRESGRFAPALLDTFATWVEKAPDEELFRTNPYDYAQAHGLPPLDAIDLLIHASRAGIFELAWGLVCPSCTAFVATRGLKSFDRERECAMCGVQVGEHLDDLVEVSFTVNAGVRRTRFHGGWVEAGADKPQLLTDAGRVYFSSLSDLGAAVRLMLRERSRGVTVVPRSAPVTMSIDAAEVGGWRVLVPGVHAVCHLVSDPAGGDTARIEIMDGFTVPPEVKVRPGPVTLEIHNRTDQSEVLVGVICMEADGDEDQDQDQDPEDEITEVTAPNRAFLSGKQILSTQSFRELFRAETLPPDASLDIRSLTFLFTDLKASTQLYDQVGDLAALGMVRSHFQVLRTVIAQRGGAIVKTIGDAVMATFVESKSAVAAGIEMHQRLREDPGARGLELKVGVHAGPCVAIDSNERLDYFGQTVNIAARVQALAEGRELVCTHDVMKDPAVAALLRDAKITPIVEEVRLKGVSQPVRVYRAREL